MQSPRPWILLGKAQTHNLADALGWPFEARQLIHNRWNRLPNLLGASILNRGRLVHLFHSQAPLHWVDLVIRFPLYRLPERPRLGAPMGEPKGRLKGGLQLAVQRIRKLMRYAATDIDQKTGGESPGGNHGVRSNSR